MKTNAPKRKVFNDAVDILMDDMPVATGKGVAAIPVDKVKAFHDHPFHLYEGERLKDMVESIREHGVLNPVIVLKQDAGYEMLSGHNRWNISVYDGCPKQYKFYKEYGFAQNQMYHTSVGSLVHATLEDMNKCIIGGNVERVTEDAIKEWFLLNYREMQEQTGYYLTADQQSNALSQVIRYYHHRKDELGRVWKAEEEINLILPKYILQGIIDLVEGDGNTVEIVDYKTGPKPDYENHPERVEHYKKQLEIYAYLIEKRYSKTVSRMHLYYTSTLEGNPIISFDWSREAIDSTIEEITETVRRIENKDFEYGVQNNYACRFCDMKHVCGKVIA